MNTTTSEVFAVRWGVVEEVFYTETTCMDCSAKITWATDDEPYPDDQFRCVTCAKKVDPWDKTEQCLNCKAHYVAVSMYSEACSSKCGYRIDELVERAQDAELAREQAWLESYGEDES